LWTTKRIEAAIANKQHFSRLRYERELEIYEDIWKALTGLQEATCLLKTRGEVVTEIQTDDELRRRKLKEFAEAFNRLLFVVRENRPFYPQLVWEKLDQLLAFCRERSVEFQADIEASSFSEFEKKFIGDRELLNQLVMGIEIAIRTRLAQFDGVT